MYYIEYMSKYIKLFTSLQKPEDPRNKTVVWFAEEYVNSRPSEELIDHFGTHRVELPFYGDTDGVIVLLQMQKRCPNATIEIVDPCLRGWNVKKNGVKKI